MDLTPLTIYLAVTILIGLLLVARAYWGLRRASRQRIRQLRKRGRMQAVRTSSPVDDPNAMAKERAQESIEQHFTVTRRLVIPIIILFTAMAASLPLLRDVSAVFVSLIATAVTVLLGVAARPAIENAIAGLILSSSNLIRIGDTVEVDSYYGTVEDITLTHTTLKIWDWRRYVVPNGRMLTSALINYSLFDRFQWACVEFFIGYEADLELVEKLAIEAAASSRHHAAHEPPQLWVRELEPTGYRCWLAAWADTPSDAWLLKADVRRALVKAFAEHGVPTHRYEHRFRSRPGN